MGYWHSATGEYFCGVKAGAAAVQDARSTFGARPNTGASCNDVVPPTLPGVRGTSGCAHQRLSRSTVTVGVSADGRAQRMRTRSACGPFGPCVDLELNSLILLETAETARLDR